VTQLLGSSSQDVVSAEETPRTRGGDQAQPDNEDSAVSEPSAGTASDTVRPGHGEPELEPPDGAGGEARQPGDREPEGAAPASGGADRPVDGDGDPASEPFAPAGTEPGTTASPSTGTVSANPAGSKSESPTAPAVSQAKEGLLQTLSDLRGPSSSPHPSVAAESPTYVASSGSEDSSTVGSDSGPVGMMPDRKATIEAASKFSTQASTAAGVLLDGALLSLRRNLALNTIARGFFYLAAAASLVVAIYFVFARFDSFVRLILSSQNAVDDRQLWRSLIAIGVPIFLALLNIVVCVSVAVFIQNKSSAESAKGIAQASRLMRESPLVPSRSLALTQILEETLANARQAFTIQLWISKFLFSAGIALLFVFVGSLFFSDIVASSGAAVTSLLAFVAAALLNPQRQIRTDLATVTQLAAILAAYTRQATVIEEHLYGLMNDPQKDPLAIGRSVYEGVDKLEAVLRSAMQSISEHVQAPDKASPREAWLWQQLALQKSPDK
jgi:hypothetical protein